MLNRIHLVLNRQVGCYAWHFDFRLTVFSSGLPTTFHDVLPQDFPLHFVIIIFALPQQEIIAPQTPPQGESGIESSRAMGTSSIMPPAETQLQHRHFLAHRDDPNAATDSMTLDAKFKTARTSGSSKP